MRAVRARGLASLRDRRASALDQRAPLQAGGARRARPRALAAAALRRTDRPGDHLRDGQRVLGSRAIVRALEERVQDRLAGLAKLLGLEVGAPDRSAGE